MKESNIKVGEYYLVNVYDNPKMIGKYLGKRDTEIGNTYDYLFEFEKSQPMFHDGFGGVRPNGKHRHCWYTKLDFILKKIPYEKVVACKL